MEQNRMCVTAEKILKAAREIRGETGAIPGTAEILEKYREGAITIDRPEEIPSVLVPPGELADAVLRFPLPLPEICEIAAEEENIFTTAMGISSGGK